MSKISKEPEVEDEDFEMPSFEEFFCDVFHPLAGIKITILPLHREVCRQLEKAYLGGYVGKQIIILNIAPRIGKSLIIKAFILWCLVLNPNSKFILTSYIARLSSEMSKNVMEWIKEPWFRALYPWVALGEKQTLEEFHTTEKGVVFTGSVSGSVTGWGAGQGEPQSGAIILDDPQDPLGAASAAENEKLKVWFTDTLWSRRNNETATPIIVIQQRISPDDLTGFLLDTYPDLTHLIKFPAIVDGKSILGSVFSLEGLLRYKEVSPAAFYGQYMQEPIILGGNLIPIDFIKTFSDNVEAIRADFKVITVDAAFKTKEANNHSVMQCWIKCGPNCFLVDQVRGKWETPQLLNECVSFFFKHHNEGGPVRKVVIEDTVASLSSIQLLRQKGLPVEALKRGGDKVERVKDILTYITSGFVWIPKSAPWVKELLAELAAFRADGKAKQDDQVDCFADGISTCLAKSLSIFDVMRITRR